MYTFRISEEKKTLLTHKLNSITDNLTAKTLEELANFQYSGPGNRLNAEIKQIRLPKIRLAMNKYKRACLEVIIPKEEPFSDYLREFISDEIEQRVHGHFNGLRQVISDYKAGNSRFTKDIEDALLKKIGREEEKFLSDLKREFLVIQGERKNKALYNRELEQKFKILWSASQAQKDFDRWLPDATKDRYPIAILFFDIDYFKNLNMKYTETMVDNTILPEAQHLLKQLTSQSGGAYRHGGEEFVVILPNHNKDEAMLFGEKIRVAFETHDFYIDGNKEKVTISVGVALWPDHGNDYSEVVNAANMAEHRAKDSGRNTVISV